MRRSIFIFCIIVLLSITKGYSQAQKEILKEIKKKPTNVQKKTFLNLINNAYAESTKKDEKKFLRKEWKKMLGIDIFYPYFKAKETERWIKEKTSIHFLKIKGEPSFKKDKVQYIFKIKF